MLKDNGGIGTLYAVVMGVIVTGLVVGCLTYAFTPKEVNGEPGEPEAKYTIDFVAHGGPEADPYWAAVVTGIEAADKILPIETHYFNPPGAYSIDAWADTVNAVLARNPDVVFTTATDPDAIDDSINEYIKAGNPVFCFDTEDTRSQPEKMDYISYIGMSDYMTGVKMAERVLAEFTPTQVLGAIHEPGHVGLEHRLIGFKDVMEPKGATFTKLDISRDPATMGPLITSYLQGHPDVDCIFSVGAITHEAILGALEDTGMLGEVTFVTVNISDTIITAIEEGNVLAAAAEQPYAIGFFSCVAGYLYKEAGVISPDMYTGPAVVDKFSLEAIKTQLEIAGVV